MGNPWAPPDQSPPPAPRGPERRTPPADGGTAAAPAPPPPGAVPPGAVPPGAVPGLGASGHHGPLPDPPRPVPPPDPAGVARATRTTAWSAGALLASVLLVGAPYPARFLAPAAAVAGLVLAIVAAVRAARARARGPVVALAVVLIVSSLAWTGVSGQTLLYVDASRDFHECRQAALTHQAQRACTVQLDNDMRERLSSLLGRLRVPAPS